MYRYRKLKAENARLTAELEVEKYNVDHARKCLLETDKWKKIQRDDLAALRRNIEAKEKEIESLKKTIREQSEADLLLNALKAVGIVPDKEERPTGYYADIDSALRQQREQAIWAMRVPGPEQSAFAALGGVGGGLGSIFGP